MKFVREVSVNFSIFIEIIFINLAWPLASIQVGLIFTNVFW